MHSSRLISIQGCCCQEETKKFLQCAFNNVYVTKYSVLDACSLNCGGGGEEEEGIPYILIGGVGGGVLLIGFVLMIIAYCYIWRRPVKSVSTTVSQNSNRTDNTSPVYDVGDIESGTTKKSNPKKATPQQKTTTDTDDSMAKNPKAGTKKGANNAKGKKGETTSGAKKAKDTNAQSRPKKKAANTKRIDATGLVSISGDENLGSKKSLHSKASKASDDANSEADMTSAPSTKPAKKKKTKKQAARERAAADADMETALRHAEQEARMLRFEKRVSTRQFENLKEYQNQTTAMLQETEQRLMEVEEELQQELQHSEAEKLAILNEVKRLEMEKIALAERVAAMEAASQGSPRDFDMASFADEDEEQPLEDPDYYCHDGRDPPLLEVDVADGESTAFSAYHEDDDSNATSWLANNISNRSRTNDNTLCGRSTHSQKSSSYDQRKRSPSLERTIMEDCAASHRSEELPPIRSHTRSGERRARSVERQLNTGGYSNNTEQLLSHSHHSIVQRHGKRYRPVERSLGIRDDSHFRPSSSRDNSPQRGVRRTRSAENTLMGGSLHRLEHPPQFPGHSMMRQMDTTAGRGLNRAMSDRRMFMGNPNAIASMAPPTLPTRGISRSRSERPRSRESSMERLQFAEDP